jgi:RNA polymerase sigma factor (sigma-70 family)
MVQANETNDDPDPALLARVRAGDPEAAGELYTRHLDDALRYARRLAGEASADDVVSEAFLKVLRLLARGDGPTEHFRGYLFTTIRSTSIDLARRTGAETPVPDEDLPLGVVDDGVDARADEQLLLTAMEQLPLRYRQVLWWGEVLGTPQKEIARRLRSNPNAVGALRHRAREALRQAYLAAHLGPVERAGCAEVVDLLPKYVRGQLSAERAAHVEAHLDCPSCARALAILRRENRNLGALLLPLLLAAPTSGLLPWATGTVAGAASRTWVAGTTAVAATAAGVAFVVYLVVMPGPATRPESGEARPSSAPTTSATPTPTERRTPHRTAPRATTAPPVPATASPTERPTPTPTPSPTPGEEGTASPTRTPTPVVTPPPTEEPSPSTTPTPTPTATETPAPTPTETPTIAVTPTTWALDWDQLPTGTSLSCQELTVRTDESGVEPWTVSPSIEVAGVESAYNFHVGYLGLPGPAPVQGLSPTNVGMVLNLHGTGSRATVTLRFSRPVSGIDLDVYSLGRDDSPDGYVEQLTFSEPTTVSGDTAHLVPAAGLGPFFRTQDHRDVGLLRFSSTFAVPRDEFTLVYTSPEPVGSHAWYRLGVGGLTLHTD